MPKGVGEAIKNNPCPKVYIPNTGLDPEQKDTSVMERIFKLVSYLRADDPAAIQTRDVLNFVLVDLENGDYGGPVHFEELEKKGIAVIDCALVSRESAPFIDEKLLAPVLISLT